MVWSDCAEKGRPFEKADFPKKDILFGRRTSVCALAQECGVGGRKGRGPAQGRDQTCKPDLATSLPQRLHHPIHRRVLPVLHRPTGLIRTVPTFRHQTL